LEHLKVSEETAGGFPAGRDPKRGTPDRTGPCGNVRSNPRGPGSEEEVPQMVLPREAIPTIGWRLEQSPQGSLFRVFRISYVFERSPKVSFKVRMIHLEWYLFRNHPSGEGFIREPFHSRASRYFSSEDERRLKSHLGIDLHPRAVIFPLMFPLPPIRGSEVRG
jgi:hypothetical protein